MTRSLGFAHVSRSSARWLLPWIAMVFVSATLAFVVNRALADNPSAVDRRPHLQATIATTETGPAALERLTTAPSRQSTVRSSLVNPERCPPIGPAFVDSIIVAESRRVACAHGLP